MSAAIESSLPRYPADWDAKVASRARAADAMQTQGIILFNL